MATPVTQRPRSTLTPTVERNAKYSAWARAKRPIPETRREAEELFRPLARNAQARTSRLARLNQLGLLAIHPGSPPITQGEAHDAILDAMYGPDGRLREPPGV